MMDEQTPPGRGPVAVDRGVILFAEDQEPLRKTVSAVLQMLGYRVIAASDGDHARALFHQHQEEISLALLDLTMPGLSGLEVAREIRQARPRLPVILSSGYGEDIHPNEGGSPVTAFLQKPYSADELARALRDALA
jgi:two-component system cell cycle sensor histidine kinase/response regulator CckA